MYDTEVGTEQAEGHKRSGSRSIEQDARRSSRRCVWAQEVKKKGDAGRTFGQRVEAAEARDSLFTPEFTTAPVHLGLIWSSSEPYKKRKQERGGETAAIDPSAMTLWVRVTWLLRVGLGDRSKSG